MAMWKASKSAEDHSEQKVALSYQCDMETNATWHNFPMGLTGKKHHAKLFAQK